MDIVVTPQTTTGIVRGPKKCMTSEGLVFSLATSNSTKSASPAASGGHFTTTYTALCAHPTDPDRSLFGDSKGTVVHVSLGRNRFHVVARLGGPISHVAFLTMVTPAACLCTIANHVYVVGIEDGTVYDRLRTHTHKIDSLSILGKLCVTLSSDSIVVWNCTTLNPKPLHTIVCGSSTMNPSNMFWNALVTSRNIVVCGRETLHLRDRLNIEETVVLTLPPERPITSHDAVSCNPDGSLLVAGCNTSASLVVYSVEQRRCARVVALPPARVRGVLFIHWFHASDEHIAVTSTSQQVYILRYQHGVKSKLLYCFDGNGKPSFATTLGVTLSADDSHMAISFSDGATRFWNLATVRQVSKERIPDTNMDKPIKSFLVDHAHQDPEAPIATEGGQNVAAALYAERRPVLGDFPTPDPTNAQQDTWIHAELAHRQVTNVTDVRRAGKSDTMGRVPQRGAGKKVSIKPRQSVVGPGGVAFPELTIQLKLDAETKEYNMERLHNLLITYGVYPEKFRSLIWKFVLRLQTGSARAFEQIAQRGPHSSMQELMSAYPLSSSKLKLSLERVLSLLAHHAPVFSHVRYVPEIVFPFVKVFQTDIRSAFEAVLVFFLNWGKEYVQYYPQPPVSLLVSLDQLLQQEDQALYDHLSSLGAGVDLWGWSVMKSLYSNVFAKSEWMQVMDHAFSNQPVWLYLFHVSWLKVLRRTLISIQTYDALEAFLQKASACDVHAAIRGAYSIHRSLDTSSVAASWGEYIMFTPITVIGDVYPTFLNFPKYAEENVEEQQDLLEKYNDAIARSERNVTEMNAEMKRLKHEEDMYVRKQRALAAGRQRHNEEVWACRLKMQRELQVILDKETEVRLHLAKDQHRSSQRFIDLKLESQATEAIEKEDAIENQRALEFWEQHNRMTRAALDEIAQHRAAQYYGARSLVNSNSKTRSSMSPATYDGIVRSPPQQSEAVVQVNLTDDSSVFQGAKQLLPHGSGNSLTLTQSTVSSDVPQPSSAVLIPTPPRNVVDAGVQDALPLPLPVLVSSGVNTDPPQPPAPTTVSEAVQADPALVVPAALEDISDTEMEADPTMVARRPIDPTFALQDPATQNATIDRHLNIERRLREQHEMLERIRRLNGRIEGFGSLIPPLPPNSSTSGTTTTTTSSSDEFSSVLANVRKRQVELEALFMDSAETRARDLHALNLKASTERHVMHQQPCPQHPDPQRFHPHVNFNDDSNGTAVPPVDDTTLSMISEVPTPHHPHHRKDDGGDTSTTCSMDEDTAEGLRKQFGLDDGFNEVGGDDDDDTGTTLSSDEEDK